MPELPASVRLALWSSAAYAGRFPLDQVPSRALPDADVVDGDLDRLALWRDLGERVVLVALPRPGDLTGMPRGSRDLVGAAAAARECVYIPGLGGALVPTIAAYGPEGDRGTQVTWTAYDAEPVPPHHVEAMSLSELELALRQELRMHTAALESLQLPWLGDTSRRRVDSELSQQRWGLPGGIPPRALSVMTVAARIATVADAGKHSTAGPSDAATTARRNALLSRVHAKADATLATAANVAALHLAGLRD